MKVLAVMLTLTVFTVLLAQTPAPARFSYSAAELLVLISGSLAALGAAVVAIITAWRTGAKVDSVDKKADKVVTEIEKVHTLTNDRATQQDKKIEELQSTIKVLITAMAQKDQQSAILADRKVQEAAIEKGGAAERAEQQTKAIGTVVVTAIEKNVEVLKQDVKEVKSDVKEVKAEVVKRE